MSAKVKAKAKAETKAKTAKAPQRTCYRSFEDESETIAKLRRSGRKCEAGLFRDEYLYCKCQDKKTCIWYGNRRRVSRYSWSDESCGITWAGVHGENSICVVTKTGDLDVSRVHGFAIFCLADKVFCNFRRAVISELEDLADPSSELHRKIDKSVKPKNHSKSIKPPFGVVSVAPRPTEVHKASCVYEETKFVKVKVEAIIKATEGDSISDESEIDSDYDEDDEDARLKYEAKLTRRSWRKAPEIEIEGYDEEKTVRFIQKEMENEETKRAAALTIDESVEESCDKCNDKWAIEFLKEAMIAIKDFSLEETVKTAISAFQHLFGKNFNANEIQVSVMDPDYFVLASEDRIKDIYVKHLETVEIEKYLSDIKHQEELTSERPVKRRYNLREYAGL